jgi:hypothetical protein
MIALETVQNLGAAGHESGQPTGWSPRKAG